MKKSVNVVIADGQGRILVLKRNSNDDIYPGFWDLPGGGVKENETLNEAAEREVAEETGLRVELEKHHFFSIHFPEEETNYVFKANLISQNVVLGGEHAEFKWVSKDNWQSVEFTPGVKATIKEFFK